jgi:hypothetical protein
LYPLIRADRRLIDRVALLDDTPVHSNDRFAIVERDVARAHARIFGFPRIVSIDSLRNVTDFYLLEPDSTRAPTVSEFPHMRISRVAPRLFHVVRGG